MVEQVIERSIAVTTHGRYLVAPPNVEAYKLTGGRAPLVVGFHGYGEAAEAQLARLRAIPGSNQWLIVSVQGLNRFYQRRTDDVIAGWMTRQDRDHAIADNLSYVAAVIDEVGGDHPLSGDPVFAGFSQGVAMAFRAAAASMRPVAGVIAVGGDVPPELDTPALARISNALVCRGVRDGWYTPAVFEKDVARLRAAGVDLRTLEFDGGHEWSDEAGIAAATFVRDHRRRDQ